MNLSQAGVFAAEREENAAAINNADVSGAVKLADENISVLKREPEKSGRDAREILERYSRDTWLSNNIIARETFETVAR